MDKKGFTLIELLAVIVLIGVVAVIAIPTIGSITGGINNRMLEEKKTFIEEAAELFGQDIKDAVVNSSATYDGYNCVKIIVSDLIPDYLEKDVEGDCKDKCIVDPSNKNTFLDNDEVIIYYKNRRIKAKYVGKSTDSCPKI